MGNDKILEANFIDGTDVTLHKIEFDNEFEGNDEAAHRTYFVFRLHAGEDARQDYHVTMTEPYDDLVDLEQKAWRELYSLLHNFAEAIRRKADLPKITFKSP